MPTYAVYFWRRVPAVRLLIPFMAGVLLQWYFLLPLPGLCIVSACLAAIAASFFFLSEPVKFSFRWVQGVAIQLLMLVPGALVTYYHDIRNDRQWIGHLQGDFNMVLATLQEPLVEKPNSYKALATINAVQQNGKWLRVSGQVLLYFKKDSLQASLPFGSTILFEEPFQKITNSGNPGAFDYQRYCAFQHIYHQVFLKNNGYVLTAGGSPPLFSLWLFQLRSSVISTLRKLIPGQREAGVAEALLIGYRDDLDKGLVQAYSNTGVVHIIAISGLHLGLIYAVLAWLFNRFKKRRWVIWVKPVVILGVLWIFSLLAGAVPSIVRSAVMFTCIVLGEAMGKKSNIYNTLAVSAFAMLCYNPFTLWDVGFQLSYAAVLGIVAFMKPVYNWLYVSNKLLDSIWQLNAVTLSAQVFTIPLVLYYFHQFPNFFLLTNFVVVPLSSFILFAELALLVCSAVPVLAGWLGLLCSAALRFMNSFIERVDRIPFSVTGNIIISVPQAWLLLLSSFAISWWLLRKSKPSFLFGLTSLVAFYILGTIDVIEHASQQKVIVYHIPRHTAVDFVNGSNCLFFGDSTVAQDPSLSGFHLQAARMINRASPALRLNDLQVRFPFFLFGNKRTLLVDKPYRFELHETMTVDVIILSKNPRVYIPELANTFRCKQFVFDGSNTAWRINQWKKDCDSLHLPHHSTAEEGAFVWNL